MDQSKIEALGEALRASGSARQLVEYIEENRPSGYSPNSTSEVKTVEDAALVGCYIAGYDKALSLINALIVKNQSVRHNP